MRINGEPVEPFWADTIPLPPNGNITFGSRVTASPAPPCGIAMPWITRIWA